MNPKRTIGLLTLIAFTLSMLAIKVFGNQVNPDGIRSDNIASVYVEEYGGYKWGSGRVDPLCRDTYSTGYRLINCSVDEWKIDQWKGPTPKSVKLKVESGAQVSAASTSGIKYDILEATSSISFTGNYNAACEESFTFPGDNRTHYLIQKVESYAYELYTTIVHAECTANSYDWYPIVGYVNIVWGPWVNVATFNYDPSGVLNRQLYTTYMTK